MSAILVETNNNGKKAYESLVLEDPKAFSVFNSKLAMKIVKSLAESPAPAIDVARKLKVHEQKIYYHIRKLAKAGVIYTISSEKRHGMIANIYTVTSPVIAAKLHDKGTELKEGARSMVSGEITEFLSPFIQDGKLNTKIIIGSTKTHGKYESRSADAPYLIDFLLFLGTSLTDFDSSSIPYKFDTDVTDADLKNNNLIIVGNPKINSITDRINTLMPIYFDVNNDFRIMSKITNNKYPYDFDAVIIKTKNPFNQNKEILLIAGKRSEGLRSAVLAIIRHTKEILNGNIKNKNIMAKVVSGVDKDSDGIVDGIKFHE